MRHIVEVARENGPIGVEAVANLLAERFGRRTGDAVYKAACRLCGKHEAQEALTYGDVGMPEELAVGAREAMEAACASGDGAVSTQTAQSTAAREDVALSQARHPDGPSGPTPLIHRASHRANPAREWEMAVLGGDAHIPFHDRDVERLFVEFIRREQPDTVVLVGDMADCESIGRFPKDHRLRIHPSELATLQSRPTDPATGDLILGTKLQRTIQLTHDYLASIREAAPNARRVYVMGNHENRLMKEVKRNAAELLGLRRVGSQEANVLDFGYLTAMDELGFEVVDSGTDESFVEWHGILLGHFNTLSMHSAYTAKLLCERKRSSVVQGHTHRGGLYYITKPNGDVQFGMEDLCLCLREAEYIHHPNWQQGWTVLQADEDGVTPQPILVRGGRYYWGSKRRG